VTATGLINTVFQAGQLTVFAGVREDPFFFDLTQWYKIVPDRNLGSTTASCLPTVGNGTCPNGWNNPGSDYFGNSDVLSIVAEFPISLLQSAGGTGTVVGYWATTSTSTGN
jgi:hypothetical protein